MVFIDLFTFIVIVWWLKNWKMLFFNQSNPRSEVGVVSLEISLL